MPAAFCLARLTSVTAVLENVSRYGAICKRASFEALVLENYFRVADEAR